MEGHKSSGFYLHVPFCRKKCLYCDFFSAGVSIANWEGFCNAAIDELNSRLPEFLKKAEQAEAIDYSTIYFGGGTPSLLPEREFSSLSSAFQSAAPGKIIEFTLEVNPEDVTPKKARLWKDRGVSRISMGIQTLSDTELKSIGRCHNASTALKAFEILRQQFDNISLDLIFGLPDQSPESLEKTLSKIISLNPEHISAYSLMYEERTALTALRNSGRIEETPEDVTVEMFRMITGKLEESSYEQYELSNYALPGYESRHNSSYWTGSPYLGIGPSAHSYDGFRIREANRPELKAYMNAKPAALLTLEKEILTDEMLREEMIMTRLRMRDGLDLNEYGKRFGETARNALIREARRWAQSEQAQPNPIQLSEDRLSLTREGIMIADEIIASLF